VSFNKQEIILLSSFDLAEKEMMFGCNIICLAFGGTANKQRTCSTTRQLDTAIRWSKGYVRKYHSSGMTANFLDHLGAGDSQSGPARLTLSEGILFVAFLFCVITVGILQITVRTENSWRYMPHGMAVATFVLFLLAP
jgi:hypothetical protein